MKVSQNILSEIQTANRINRLGYLYIADLIEENKTYIYNVFDRPQLRAAVNNCRNRGIRNMALCEAAMELLRPHEWSHCDRGKKDEHAQTGKHYEYIPLKPNAFWDLIRAFLPDTYGSKKFLDVGCGIGDKVLAAHYLGFDASGLEYSDDLIAAGNLWRGALYGNTDPAKVFQHEALIFNGYGDYDVIYMYSPIQDPELMASLYMRIANQMKPGAVMIEAHAARSMFGAWRKSSAVTTLYCRGGRHDLPLKKLELPENIKL